MFRFNQCYATYVATIRYVNNLKQISDNEHMFCIIYVKFLVSCYQWWILETVQKQVGFASSCVVIVSKIRMTE